MKNIYIVRHGETILNLLNRSQGWADSPLTWKGEQQAETLGKTIKETPITFDAAYTSDSGRARETARLVLNYSENSSVPLTETETLREAAFGSFEGYNNDEMWEQAGLAVGISGMSRKSPIDLKIKAIEGIKKSDTINYAEGFEEVSSRIEDLKNLISSSEASSILLVSHSLLICCILHVLFPDGLKIDKVPNASVTKIHYSKEAFHLDYIGRTEEL
ncbi:histidine phosphatase family protein [Sporolactobacillus shoreae]|uniref:phosphoglycerate mutase (2,3-diphosphoglycerate-dependent) n=1 Tax=Sporolactobacillus shoreae TaxID=1465501 RepID=A0A4Z0GH00_9BACL|nr:histidine phosphatase family protein [Sporolactobacillus shoreae]TGA95933.1 histidine phosphatase family protein [Sporolactobacillus shoreae]